MGRNEALREARKQRHWTQSTLATQLNTTRTTVLRWEQGKVAPGLYFRAQLCQIFRKTEQELGLDQRPEEGPSLPFWQYSPFFTGREAALHHLDQTFWEDQAPGNSRVSILNGPIGIGKTQVALAYARRFQHRYSMTAWLNAATGETIAADLRKLALALHLPVTEATEDARVTAMLKHWLEHTDNWLLIFDHVEEFALISPFLSTGNPTRHVLITTRMQATGRFPYLTLATLDIDESALLLLRRAKLLPAPSDLTAVSAERSSATRQLCRELGYLPLALDQAGAYMEETGCSPEGYLLRFQRHHAELLSWHGQSGTAARSVAAVVRTALENVRQQSRAAYDLLCVCAFLHPEHIPEELILQGASHLGVLLQETVIDLLSLDRAFAVLNASALLRREPETHVLNTHCLVQTVLKDLLPPEDYALWAERCLHAFHALFPDRLSRQPGQWSLCAQLLPHMLACIGQIAHISGQEKHRQCISTSIALLLKAVDFLQENSQDQETDALLQCTYDLAQRLGAADSPEETSNLARMALLYQQLEASGGVSTSIPLGHLEGEVGHSAETLPPPVLLQGQRGAYHGADAFA